MALTAAERRNLLRALTALSRRADDFIDDTVALLTRDYSAALGAITRDVVGDLPTADGRYTDGLRQLANARRQLLTAGGAFEAISAEWLQRLDRTAAQVREHFETGESATFDDETASRRADWSRSDLAVIGELKGQWPTATEPGSGLAGRFFSLSDTHRRALADSVTRAVLGRRRATDLDAELATLLERDAGQAKWLLDDATMQFSRSTHLRKADELGYEWFLYIGPEDAVTRPFCRPLVETVHTREEIDDMDNKQTGAGTVFVAGGGYRCRHHWRAVRPSWFSDEEWAEMGGADEADEAEVDPPETDELDTAPDQGPAGVEDAAAGPLFERSEGLAGDEALTSEQWAEIHGAGLEKWGLRFEGKALGEEEYAVNFANFRDTRKLREFREANPDAWEALEGRLNPDGRPAEWKTRLKVFVTDPATGDTVTGEDTLFLNFTDEAAGEALARATPSEVRDLFGAESLGTDHLLWDVRQRRGGSLVEEMKQLRTEVTSDLRPSDVVRFQTGAMDGQTWGIPDGMSQGEVVTGYASDFVEFVGESTGPAWGPVQTKGGIPRHKDLIEIADTGDPRASHGLGAHAAPSEFGLTSADLGDRDNVAIPRVDVGQHKFGDDAKATVWHEMGHWLESKNGRVLDASQQFLISRFEDEEILSMRELYGNDGYKGAERGFADGFFTPYVGKIYGPIGDEFTRLSATEVTSTGVEHFVNADEMARLWEADPGHFAHVMNVLENRYGYRQD